MPIDPQKARGAKLPDGEGSYDEGPGDPVPPRASARACPPPTPSELEYTYEKNLKVLPSFAVVPAFGSMGGIAQRPGHAVQLRDAAARRAGGDPAPAAAAEAEAQDLGAHPGDLRQGQGRARDPRDDREATSDGPAAVHEPLLAVHPRRGRLRRRLGPEGRQRGAGAQARRRRRAQDAAAAGADLPALRRQEPAPRAIPTSRSWAASTRRSSTGSARTASPARRSSTRCSAATSRRSARYQARFARRRRSRARPTRSRTGSEGKQILLEAKSVERNAPIISNAVIELR